MSERELTKEQVQEIADHIASGKLVGYINQWLFHDDALRAERDAYKAVLVGAEYQRLDLIAAMTVERAERFGQEAARVTRGIMAERDALKGELTEAKCGESLCGHDHSTQYWELRANKAEMLATDAQEAVGHYMGEAADLTRKLAEANAEIADLEKDVSRYIDYFMSLEKQVVALETKLEAIQNTVGEENWSLREKLAEAQNEICTASDQIPPDLDGDSLSVALIKLKDKLAASEQAVKIYWEALQFIALPALLGKTQQQRAQQALKYEQPKEPS